VFALAVIWAMPSRPVAVLGAPSAALADEAGALNATVAAGTALP